MKRIKFILLILLIILLNSCKNDDIISLEYCCKTSRMHAVFFFNPDRLPKLPDEDKSYKRIKLEKSLGFID